MKRIFLVLLLAIVFAPLQFVEAQAKPFRHKGQTVKQWLDQTEGGSKASRMSAVVALGEIGARATDALIVVTSRRDPDVRQLAITFIGVTTGQDSKIVPVLCRSLSDKKQSVREAAAESLFNRGQAGRDVLHKNSRSKELSLRRGSYRGVVILQLDDKKSISMIIRGLTDEDKVVWYLSINAVKNLKGKAAAGIPILVGLIDKARNNARRQHCLSALEEIGVQAIPAVNRLKLHKDLRISTEAKEILGRLKLKPRLY
ncbi:MAG: HEAT repeat domain-containing protein [Planctomycetota bacterium]|nr:HEAT repeat domain-containing protein [Planctomycetota bacterium]